MKGLKKKMARANYTLKRDEGETMPRRRIKGKYPSNEERMNVAAMVMRIMVIQHNCMDKSSPDFGKVQEGIKAICDGFGVVVDYGQELNEEDDTHPQEARAVGSLEE